MTQHDSEFETALAAALRVPTPPELAARVLTQCEALPRRSGMSQHWALAASVLLGVVLSLWFVQPAPQSLGGSVLQHVYHEISALQRTQTVPLAQAKRLLAQVGGVRLVGEVGTIVYARLCPMREGMGVHWVLQGERGAVTVFFMPKDEVSGRQVVTDGRFEGVIVPVARGSLAIVGEVGEPLAAVESRLLNGLQWQS